MKKGVVVHALLFIGKGVGVVKLSEPSHLTVDHFGAVTEDGGSHFIAHPEQRDDPNLLTYM